MERSSAGRFRITIKGISTESREESIVTQYAEGGYYLKNGAVYILYEEKTEDGTILKSRLRIAKDRMELVRGGDVSSKLVFEKDVRHTAHYFTPYGRIELGITARELCVTESEGGMRIRVAYVMDAGDGYREERRLDITATPI